MAEKPPAQAAGQPGRPRAPRQRQPGHVLVVRVPQDLLRRLEAHIAWLQEAHPYLRLSRAAVLRTLPVLMASCHSRTSGNPGDEYHGDWMPACAGMTLYRRRTYETDIEEEGMRGW
jgi:hypothetical protein